MIELLVFETVMSIIWMLMIIPASTSNSITITTTTTYDSDDKDNDKASIDNDKDGNISIGDINSIFYDNTDQNYDNHISDLYIT